jgi:hypothetical protein
MAYCTVDDVAAYLGLDELDAPTTALLTKFVNAAQATIEMHTGRVYEPVEETHYLSPLTALRAGALQLDGPLLVLTSLTGADGIAVDPLTLVGDPFPARPPYFALRWTHDLAWGVLPATLPSDIWKLIRGGIDHL